MFGRNVCGGEQRRWPWRAPVRRASQMSRTCHPRAGEVGVVIVTVTVAGLWETKAVHRAAGDPPTENGAWRNQGLALWAAAGREWSWPRGPLRGPPSATVSVHPSRPTGPPLLPGHRAPQPRPRGQASLDSQLYGGDGLCPEVDTRCCPRAEALKRQVGVPRSLPVGSQALSKRCSHKNEQTPVP